MKSEYISYWIIEMANVVWLTLMKDLLFCKKLVQDFNIGIHHQNWLCSSATLFTLLVKAYINNLGVKAYIKPCNEDTYIYMCVYVNMYAFILYLLNSSPYWCDIVGYNCGYWFSILKGHKLVGKHKKRGKNKKKKR